MNTDEIAFREFYLGGLYEVVLTKHGKLFVKKTDKSPFQEHPWYKNTNNKEPWIPQKRKSFVSLIKMSIREGDFIEALTESQKTPKNVL
jgi:hypothetical protein